MYNRKWRVLIWGVNADNGAGAIRWQTVHIPYGVSGPNSPLRLTVNISTVSPLTSVLYMRTVDRTE